MPKFCEKRNNNFKITDVNSLIKMTMFKRHMQNNYGDFFFS